MSEAQSASAKTLLDGNDYGRAMTLALVLGLGIVISALAVTYKAYEYRQLFHRQQSLLQYWDDLQVEWGQLLLEQSALGANNRVERIAQKRLAMRAPDPKNIRMVRHDR